MRISDWSSDVCSSDLLRNRKALASDTLKIARHQKGPNMQTSTYKPRIPEMNLYVPTPGTLIRNHIRQGSAVVGLPRNDRSEEHTSELQSLMRISYAVFCFKKKKKQTHTPTNE